MGADDPNTLFHFRSFICVPGRLNEPRSRRDAPGMEEATLSWRDDYLFSLNQFSHTDRECGMGLGQDRQATEDKIVTRLGL